MAEMCKPCEIYCPMRNVHGGKMFTHWLNMGLPQQAWAKRRVDGMETHRLSGKEKDPRITVREDGHVESSGT